MRGMAFQPTVEEQNALADTFRMRGAGIPPRERLTELAVSVGFLAAVAAFW